MCKRKKLGIVKETTKKAESLGFILETSEKLLLKQVKN